MPAKFRSIIAMAAVLTAVSAVLAAPSTAPSTQSSPAATRLDQSPILAPNTVLYPDLPYAGPDPALNRLDIYAPADVSAAPVVVFVHGGEWSRGDKKEISYKPQFFNNHRIVFVSVNYRLSPKYKHPAQVDDVATALAWIHAHVRQYGGDPAKIILMGHSAGCHLVTLVALNPQPLQQAGLTPADLRGVVAWSGGMYDLVARAAGPGMYPPFIRATFGDSESAQRAASPISYVQYAKDAPPFLFASVDDQKSKTSREAAEQMVQLIAAGGGKAQAVLLVGKTHFSADHLLGAPGDAGGQILLRFIDEVTKF